MPAPRQEVGIYANICVYHLAALTDAELNCPVFSGFLLHFYFSI